jgi:hypothetical protein
MTRGYGRETPEPGTRDAQPARRVRIDRQSTSLDDDAMSRITTSSAAASRQCVAIAAAVAVMVTALLPPATAGAHLSCRSGHTEFHSGPTRIFRTRARERIDSTRGGVAWYVCSARLRRPRRFASGNGYSTDELSEFRRFGRRVGFAWAWSDGVESGWDAGWVDVTSGRERNVEINSAGGDTDIPSGPLQAVAVSATGAIAFLEQPRAGSEVIGYAGTGRTRRAHPRAIATVPAGDVVADSLTISAAVIAWMTTSGGRGSAIVPQGV